MPPTPSPGGTAAVRGIGQSVGTLDAQRTFISPLDPAWSYSHGVWARTPHPGWPADRMSAMLSDAWLRSGQVLQGGVGHRCAIATDSTFMTLLAEGKGQSLSVSLDGGPPVRVGPLPQGGTRGGVPLFENRTGTTRVDLIFDDGGENDGVYIASGAKVSRAPDRVKPRRLIVLGNGYAAGAGAGAPGVTGCVALVGERLNIETVNQGWEGTDVDIRGGGTGNLANSGLDRATTDVIALKPAAVLLIYGHQAAAAARASWEYAYHYAELLRTIRTALPAVPVFCSGFPAYSADLSAAFLQEWNGAVRSAANTVDNCPFVDAAAWWGPANYGGGGGPIYVTADKLHPNDAGHRFLADKYAAAIAPYMG